MIISLTLADSVEKFFSISFIFFQFENKGFKFIESILVLFNLRPKHHKLPRNIVLHYRQFIHIAHSILHLNHYIFDLQILFLMHHMNISFHFDLSHC